MRDCSAAVYGVPAGSEPLNEDAVARPVTPYGQAKRAMEVMAERCPALALTILRIGNVAGADQMFRAMSTATAGAPLVLDRFSDGRTPVRSYIGPLTLANCLATLVGMSAQAPLPRLLNVGAGDGGVEMAGLLAAMARAGRPVPHRFRAAPPGALPALRLDCARLLALCPMPQQAGTAAVLVEEWLALTAGPR